MKKWSSKLFLLSLLVVLLCKVEYCKGWTVLESTGMIPYDRNGGQMREIGNELILFGGFKECFDENLCEHVFYNDVYHFNLDNNTWYSPIVIPDPVYGIPEPRAFFGCLVDDDENALVIYGGTSYPIKFIDFGQWNSQSKTFDDLWYYYPEDNSWKKIVYTPTLHYPGPRSGSGIEKFGHKIIMVGGINSNTFTTVEDTWKFDLHTHEWTKLTDKFSSSEPYGRYIFPFIKHGNKAYVLSGNIAPFGEWLGRQYQDLWEYKVSTNQWNELTSVVDTGFTGRVHGGAIRIGDRIVTFFGDDNDDATECRVDSISSGHSTLNETWVYKIHPAKSRKWVQVQFDIPVPALKRIYYCSSESRQKIYVYGGFDMTCPIGQPDMGVLTLNNQLYVLDYSTIQ